jgi:hypothetical protein
VRDPVERHFVGRKHNGYRVYGARKSPAVSGGEPDAACFFDQLRLGPDAGERWDVRARTGRRPRRSLRPELRRGSFDPGRQRLLREFHGITNSDVDSRPTASDRDPDADPGAADAHFNPNADACGSAAPHPDADPGASDPRFNANADGYGSASHLDTDPVAHADPDSTDADTFGDLHADCRPSHGDADGDTDLHSRSADRHTDRDTDGKFAGGTRRAFCDCDILDGNRPRLDRQLG